MRSGVAFAALCLFHGAASVHAVEKRQPNVVIILVDDLGWKDLSCQGSNFYRTPHIDRLASQGLRHTKGYAAASICSPTRAALMTGRAPARLGITDWIRARFQSGNPNAIRKKPTEYEGGPNQKLLCPPNPFWLELEEVTLAEILKQLGYVTCHIGKWHLGDDDWYPQHQGFDFNVGGCDFGQPPSYFDPYANKKISGIPHLAARKAGEFLTDREADEAVSFIRKHKDRPFFLHLAPYAVHTPIMAKPEVTAKYKGKADGEQKNATYAALVESVDDLVGTVMKALDDLGLAEDTIVIFTSDNGGLVGPTHNAPLKLGKGHATEGGLREPWIVRWSGTIPPGKTPDEPIITMDVVPTIAELAGAKLPKNRPLDGISLAEHWRTGGAAKLNRTSLYWHFPHYRHEPGPYSVIRSGDWKLVKYYEGHRLELYDLKTDESESRNLAETHSERVRAMHSDLNAWLQNVGAKLPKENPGYVGPTKKGKAKE
ncbi:MAG: sulfatase [Gemmataceae bacterium]